MPAEIYGEQLPLPAAAASCSRFEEIERLARLFVALGVEKIRITGGEPLLRHELPELIARLAAIAGAARPHADHQRRTCSRRRRDALAAPGCTASR